MFKAFYAKKFNNTTTLSHTVWIPEHSGKYGKHS